MISEMPMRCDQVALMAFGAETRMRSNARISMMARSSKLHQQAGYRCARPTFSKSSFSACYARPVHTDGPKRDMRVQSTNLCGSITVMSYRPCQSIRVPALNAAAARRKSVLP
jgi:hypothetical protein